MIVHVNQGLLHCFSRTLKPYGLNIPVEVRVACEHISCTQLVITLVGSCVSN